MLRRAAITIVVLAVVLAPTAAARAASWIGDDPTAFDSAMPSPVAATPSGGAVGAVLWGGGVAVRRAGRTGPFGPVTTMRGSKDVAGAAVGATRDLIAVAWGQDDGSTRDVYARDGGCCRLLYGAVVRRGRATRPRLLSAPGANADPVRLVTTSRRAALAWVDARGARTSVASSRGFAAPQTFQLDPYETLLGVSLPRTRPHVFVVQRGGPPTLSEAWFAGGHVVRRVLGTYPGGAFDRATCSTPAGRLVILSDGGTYEQPRLIVTTHRPGHGVRATDLAAAGAFAPVACALTPGGRGLLATETTGHDLALRTISPAGRIGPPVRVRLAADGPGGPVAIALDARGRGVLAARVVTDAADDYADLRAWPIDVRGHIGRGRTIARANDLNDLNAVAASGVTRVALGRHDGLYVAKVPGRP